MVAVSPFPHKRGRVERGRARRRGHAEGEPGRRAARHQAPGRWRPEGELQTGEFPAGGELARAGSYKPRARASPDLGRGDTQVRRARTRTDRRVGSLACLSISQGPAVDQVRPSRMLHLWVRVGAARSRSPRRSERRRSARGRYRRRCRGRSPARSSRSRRRRSSRAASVRRSLRRPPPSRPSAADTLFREKFPSTCAAGRRSSKPLRRYALPQPSTLAQGSSQCAIPCASATAQNGV